MTNRTHDPLAGVELVLVDGTNLLHAMAAAAGRADRLPSAALVGRLRAVIPPAVAIEIVFDGSSERGPAGRRIASGTTVRHAGRRSADEVIVGIVREAVRSPGDRHSILVVTDDRELRAMVGAAGATSAGCGWLIGRLSRTRLSAPTTGHGRAPMDPAAGERDDERAPWKPGRGATTKRGNPRRRPRGGPATMPR